MDKIKHNGNNLPNNYGPHYTIHKSVGQHLFEILVNLIKLSYGMVLVLYRCNLRKEEHVQNRQKMEDPRFEKHMDILQLFKYGAMLYIAVAMVAIPSGTCSSSYHSLALKFPLIVAHHASENSNTPIEPEIDPTSEFMAEGPGEKQPLQQSDDADKPPFHGPILQASQMYEVDIALIRAIIMAESSNNPRAISHRGAKGLMQLMPTTAKSLGVDDAFDPALNIDGGVRYFKRLLDRFNGDVKLALAAYNAGSRYVRKYGGVPPFKATHLYIKKVLEYRQKYQEETASSQSHLIHS